MRKGFFFSLDSAMALLVVIWVATLLAVHFQAIETRGEVFAVLSTAAGDTAIVGHYLGKWPQETGLKSFISSEASSGACSVAYELEPEIDNDVAEPIKISYCEERP